MVGSVCIANICFACSLFGHFQPKLQSHTLSEHIEKNIYCERSWSLLSFVIAPFNVNHSQVVVISVVDSVGYSTFQKRMVHHVLQQLCPHITSFATHSLDAFKQSRGIPRLHTAVFALVVTSFYEMANLQLHCSRTHSAICFSMSLHAPCWRPQNARHILEQAKSLSHTVRHQRMHFSEMPDFLSAVILLVVSVYKIACSLKALVNCRFGSRMVTCRKAD